MSFEITTKVLHCTEHEAFKSQRADYREGYDRTLEVEVKDLDDAALKDLSNAAVKGEDKQIAFACEAILSARGGKFDRPIPNFKAFAPMLEFFLKDGIIDGWIYVQEDDGLFYPQLVTAITFFPARRQGDVPSVIISTTYYGLKHREEIGVQRDSYSFIPSNVSRKKISDALTKKGIYKETEALKRSYLRQMRNFSEKVENEFAKQFLLTGEILSTSQQWGDREYKETEKAIEGRKVIHDTAPDDWGSISEHAPSSLFEESGAIPRHPVVSVYDLKTHYVHVVNGEFLTIYKYDSSLREKLILPQTHRDLLDVLTTDMSVLTSDIISGKSAGNVILNKGPAGVGKTLTAEVYAELIRKPLLSVHSGLLGVTVTDIHKHLEKVFNLSKRWDCVLLLDEADVFVEQRGHSVEQNAICAEFLRTLEYFDGLLFMTTNRPNDIDEAIVSRCAAIIQYDPPKGDDCIAIWKVMAKQFGMDLSDKLVQDLLVLFPSIRPRDIKMIMRLSLRMAKSKNQKLDIETFRKAGMFRAVEMSHKSR